ncbi:MAG: hypothetical protein ACFFBD_29105, partial [Candidatus Hodarchaeota archaeon]
MDSIQTFEMILEHGSRDTTYKFCLLLGVVDYIIENPLQTPTNNFHFIPIFYLAKQFLAYYYPLISAKIRQGPLRVNRKSIALEGYLESFQEKVKQNKSVPFSVYTPETTNKLYLLLDTEILPEELVKLIYQIRHTILEQPLQYIRNVRGERMSFFGLLSRNISYDSSFDDHRKAGLGLSLREVKQASSWEELEALENCNVFLSHQTYREIAELRFWLRDVLIKRWAQECIQ